MSKSLLKVAGACLALTGLAFMPLQASAQQDNAVVTRDAVTGKLRAANDDEVADLNKIKAEKARMFRVARKELMARIHVSGGRGTRLTDDSMSASVAVVGADGKVTQECFDSAEEARNAMASGTLTHSHTHLTPVSE